MFFFCCAVIIQSLCCFFPPATVKDYQLVQQHDCSSSDSYSDGPVLTPTSAHLSRYLHNFIAIISHLLQTGVDSSAADAVEATWVLSLALKGLYNTLKVPLHTTYMRPHTHTHTPAQRRKNAYKLLILYKLRNFSAAVTPLFC